jgi:hypothetical protein
MARLYKGESEKNQKRVWWVVKSAPLGVSEANAADDLGWDRRRLNNYLRELEKEGKVKKKGQLWFLQDDKD